MYYSNLNINEKINLKSWNCARGWLHTAFKTRALQYVNLCLDEFHSTSCCNIMRPKYGINVIKKKYNKISWKKMI